MENAIQRVFDGTTHEAIAIKCGLKRPAVSMWKLKKRIPAEHVLTVEELTGVSRHELRPDIFGHMEDCKGERVTA